MKRKNKGRAPDAESVARIMIENDSLRKRVRFLEKKLEAITKKVRAHKVCGECYSECVSIESPIGIFLVCGECGHRKKVVDEPGTQE